ncbi:alpha-L-fucosidase, partial [candidate division KSB1 bacterium]|nr:alpha-L-fucosidase [candidate division KSB1 bacterium]
MNRTATADKMDWWKDAKFGMFIHWGIYAVPARGEWVMNQEKIPIAEYEKFAEQFNPVQFHADEWVQVAKEAGQKYLVITTKHHDGFCMWDSKVTNYDIIDRTPFKRDVIRELTDACERAGIVFGVYHSILDWHHPDVLAGRIRAYRDNYLFPQVQELIENYHPKIMWFDGDWQSGWSDADARALYNLCISLDPEIIVNDRVKRWMSNPGDYVTPEQEIPEKPLQRPWESCQTINWNW